MDRDALRTIQLTVDECESAGCTAAERSAGVVQPQTPRVALFGIEIDSVSMSQAVEIVSSWLDDERSRCQYVVTPNVDHVVQLQNYPRKRHACAAASLGVADGWPVVTAARLLKKPLPERLAGSDLVPRLFSRATPRRRLRTYLLGAGPGVAERVAKRIEQWWPNVSGVGTNSPPLGLEDDPRQCDTLVQSAADAQPHLMVVVRSSQSSGKAHRARTEPFSSIAQ